MASNHDSCIGPSCPSMLSLRISVLGGGGGGDDNSEGRLPALNPAVWFCRRTWWITASAVCGTR